MIPVLLYLPLLQLINFLSHYSTMSIFHLNIHGFCSYRNDLRYLLLIYEPQIICLQETFLVQPPTQILNYHLIHFPLSITASILIHHKIPLPNLNIETTILYTGSNLPSTLDYHCFCLFFHFPILLILMLFITYFSNFLPFADNQ